MCAHLAYALTRTCERMPDEPVVPMKVAILGTDALLVAHPVDWVQLTRACVAAGFDFVAPLSWGEELIASHVGERMADSGRSTAIAVSCPLVGEQLRPLAPPIPVIKTVAPPVACARYMRAAFHPRRLHVTYVGACPGAVHPELDDQCSPGGVAHAPGARRASICPPCRITLTTRFRWSVLVMHRCRAVHRTPIG